jgi:hypothetical protein
VLIYLITEIPFKPHESCILDFSDFSGYADLDGYELARLFDRDGLDFVFDDIDALELFEFEPIDYDALGKLQIDFFSTHIHI